MKPYPIRQSGFGLLEVVFSTAIFIVVVGSMVVLGRVSARNAAISTHRAVAVNLAQDGLETIRQLRDSAWISRATTKRGDENEDWLMYLKCESANRTYQKVSTTDLYAIKANPDLANELCLRTAPLGNSYTNPAVTGDDSAVILHDSTNRPDPGAPLAYKRVVRFEAVPNTNTACNGGASDYTGLQFLAPDPTGSVCTVPNIEEAHAIKVVTTVYWRDFERDWSVSLNTILTNWRSK